MWALTQAVQEQNFFLPLNADIIQKKKRDWKIMKHIYYLPHFREISLTRQIASTWTE